MYFPKCFIIFFITCLWVLESGIRAAKLEISKWKQWITFTLNVTGWNFYRLVLSSWSAQCRCWSIMQSFILWSPCGYFKNSLWQWNFCTLCCLRTAIVFLRQIRKWCYTFWLTSSSLLSEIYGKPLHPLRFSIK